MKRGALRPFGLHASLRQRGAAMPRMAGLELRMVLRPFGLRTRLRQQGTVLRCRTGFL
jgi:hypothetical protein